MGPASLYGYALVKSDVPDRGGRRRRIYRRHADRKKLTPPAGKTENLHRTKAEDLYRAKAEYPYRQKLNRGDNRPCRATT